MQNGEYTSYECFLTLLFNNVLILFIKKCIFVDFGRKNFGSTSTFLNNKKEKNDPRYITYIQC